jgi:hypothetical protein
MMGWLMDDMIGLLLAGFIDKELLGAICVYGGFGGLVDSHLGGDATFDGVAGKWQDPA